MFKVCQDIQFLEELKQAGFSENYFIMFSQDRPFYMDTGGAPIYDKFRKEKKLYGQIIKPTGKQDAEVNLSGEHSIIWNLIKEPLQYFLLVV